MDGGLAMLVGTLCFMYGGFDSPTPLRDEYTTADMAREYYAYNDGIRDWGTRLPYHILATDIKEVTAKKTSAKYQDLLDDYYDEDDLAINCFALERDFLIRNGFARLDRNGNKIKLRRIPIEECGCKPWEWDEESEE